MTELFYFPGQSILCWVAGYTRDRNTSSVSEMIQSLTENATKFSEVSGAKFEDIKTYYVQDSRRYKYMRVFYADVPAENVPEEAYKVENPEWTMHKWLAD